MSFNPFLYRIPLIKIKSNQALFLILFFFINITGCISTNQETSYLVSSSLVDPRPQPILSLNSDLIAIGDVKYQGGVWGQGQLVLFNVQTNQVERIFELPVANPQRLFMDDQFLYVLSTGTMSFNRETPQSSWSALSRLPLNTLSGEIQHILFYNHTQRGAFIDGLVHNEQIWMSSSLSHQLVSLSTQPSIEEEASFFQSFSLDSSMGQELNPSQDQEDSLGLGALVHWRDWVLWIDFNQDRLFFINEQGHVEPCQPHLGDFELEMEGAQTPFIQDDHLWISFGLSGGLKEFDLSTLSVEEDKCQLKSFSYQPALGHLPNDLLVNKKFVFVLDSSTHDVWVYDRETRTLKSRWPLESNTHPWHFTFSSDQQSLIITEWQGGGIQWMSAQNGRLQKRISAEQWSPSSSLECRGIWNSTAYPLPQESTQIEYHESQQENPQKQVIEIDLQNDPFFKTLPSFTPSPSASSPSLSVNTSSSASLALWIAPQSGPFTLEISPYTLAEIHNPLFDPSSSSLWYPTSLMPDQFWFSDLTRISDSHTHSSFDSLLSTLSSDLYTFIDPYLADGSSFLNLWFPSFSSLALTSSSSPHSQTLTQLLSTLVDSEKESIDSLVQTWIESFTQPCTLFWPSSGAQRFWTDLPLTSPIKSLRFVPTSTQPILIYGIALHHP